MTISGHNGNGTLKVPGRQRNRITPEEWEMIRKYKAELQRETARIEAAEQGQAEEEDRPPKVFGYVRCSHEYSKESGRGEDSQQNMILGWADFLHVQNPDLPPVEWMHEEDPVSAYKVPLRRRPKGREMNRALRKGDHVIFAYLDRVFRNTEDCLATMRQWKKRGIIAHFANVRIDMDSAMGEMLITILAACAQMESAMKSERIKGVNATLVKEGRKPNGHAPIGYKLIGPKGKRRKMVMDWDARRIMGEIVRVRDKHHWPWRQISDYIETWLAEKFGCKPTPPWEKRLWSAGRCCRGYREELRIRQAAVRDNAAREDDGVIH